MCHLFDTKCVSTNIMTFHNIYTCYCWWSCLRIYQLLLLLFHLNFLHDVWQIYVYQANAVSGTAVQDECKLKFLELKAKRNYRFIIFKIDGQEVVVEKLGSPEESYDNFTNSLPPDECRYAVFDFDFTTNENIQKSKIFFIAWYT